MDKYPYTIYLAAGTQAGQPSKNQLYLMKLSKMHKTKYDDESDREDPEDGDIMNDEEGEIHMQSVVGLKNGVNRIRTMNYQPIVAYWSENGDVVIANLRPLYDVIDSEKKAHNINQLQHRSFANPQEGFALDWNPLQTGTCFTFT
jgi:ribosome assembly protein RRB1